MHIAELAAMALIEDDDNLFIRHGMPRILLDERAQLLDGRDDDARIAVLQLPFEDRRGRIAVRRALFKTVVLLHRLIVEILPVYDEEHFIDIRKARRKLGSLKGSQRLAAARRMPDIAAALDGAIPFIVVRNFDAV